MFSAMYCPFLISSRWRFDPYHLIDTKCCCPFVSTCFEGSSVGMNIYNVDLCNIQLSTEGEVNSGGYIPRREAQLVFTKSVDSNFRAFRLAPVTWNILGYSLFCKRREKRRVVSRKFQKKKLKKRFFIHLIW